MLGVDGCRVGWVGALLRDGQVELVTAGDIRSLVGLAERVAPPAVVAIDIPIGLPDAGPRASDSLVRRRLPGRASSVFPALSRAAYEAPTVAEGRAANLAATGRSASAQAWSLRHGVLDVDRWLQDGPAVRVVEVHPELCFATMAGEVLPPKRGPGGEAARRRVLADTGVEPPRHRPPGCGVDDVLDACAAAWTALRVWRGEAECVPDPPETFGDGLPAATWV